MSSAPKTLYSIAIFIFTMLVYASNGFSTLTSYDTAPNSLYTLNLLENHKTDFDAFKTTFPPAARYMFTLNKSGHLESTFPIGPAIVSAPIYIMIDAAAHAKHIPLPITSPSFERKRKAFEKLAGMIIASSADVIFFLCAAELSSISIAALLTAIFAFATSMWSISAQGLWQHGPVNLVLLCMILSLLKSRHAMGKSHTAWILSAGFCAGFLTTVRPTTALFSIAAFAWMFTRRSKLDLAYFVITALVGVAPAALWNLSNFHNLSGGYSALVGHFHISLVGICTQWLGLGFSPSKGLFVYFPLTVLSIAGAVAALRGKESSHRLLAFLGIAGFCLYCSYAPFQYWYGGHCYGPRYLTDIDGILVLLFIPCIEKMHGMFSRSRKAASFLTAIICFCVLYSVGAQAAGVYGDARSSWNLQPLNIDTHTDRVWNIWDSQIIRDARTAYRRLRPNEALKPSYIAGFRADVVGLRASCITAPLTIRLHIGQECDMQADIRNTGSVPLFGYATGIRPGQAVVRIRILSQTKSGSTAWPDQYLYIKDSYLPGATTVADGTLVAPAERGAVNAELTVINDGYLSQIYDQERPYKVRIITP